MRNTNLDRDPDETVDIKSLIAEVIDKPDEWMITPNDQLGGERPQDLIGGGSEERLRELARAIKIGMPT